MRKIFPYPLLGLSLVIMWLLLQQSASIGNILLGVFIAFLASISMLALRPEKARFRFYSPAVPRLAFIVLADIIRSNIAVTQVILLGKRRERVSGFISMPLDMQNRYGLAVLAIIITATPGTLWMQHDLRHNMLLVHVLDLVDESQWIKLIKNRYERLLMEIFE